MTTRAYRTLVDIPELASLLPGLPPSRPAIERGTVVYRFTNCTYGVMGDDETAISFELGEYPAYGVPTAALEEIPPCEACGERPGTYDGGLCDPCYWAAVDLELSCDWLPDEEAAQ